MPYSQPLKVSSIPHFYFFVHRATVRLTSTAHPVPGNQEFCLAPSETWSIPKTLFVFVIHLNLAKPITKGFATWHQFDFHYFLTHENHVLHTVYKFKKI
jgi:hypothetical protein